VKPSGRNADLTWVEPLMHDLAEGDKLDRFELTSLVARSGMASIFKARDTASGAVVALKIPFLQLESDVVFFERFTREEELLTRLEHPNIVKAVPVADKSRLYMALEWLDGATVRSIIGKGPLPRQQALAIAQQTCEALAYLHGHGIVHRDLKPENLILGSDGRVKLLDFGIALDKASRRLTWAGFSSTLGTPDYMAPEQIAGRRGDVRTDVYAAGVLLYEMLTGGLPFAGENALAIMKAKTSEEPRPPSYHVPDFDVHLDAIIMKAIERNPRDRHATMEELLGELKNPAAVPPRDPLASHGRSPPGLFSGALQGRFGPPVVAALVVAGLLGLIWLSSSRKSRGPARLPGPTEAVPAQPRP
jgi:serine/threonine-protein kinase